MKCLDQPKNIASAYEKCFTRLFRTGICWYEIEYLMSYDQRSSPHINTGFAIGYIMFTCKNFLFQNMGMGSQKMMFYTKKNQSA